MNTISRTRFRRGEDRRLRGSLTHGTQTRLKERRVKGPEWLSLFHGADTTVVETALCDCDVVALPAGIPLLKPGEANENVYLLLSGRLAILLDQSQPPESGIVIVPGESVGEMSAIDGKPVSALVIALTDVRLLRLPADLLWGQLSAVPGIARNLLAALSDRMRLSNESMLDAQRRQLAMEYLRKELETARQLQSSMLPLQRPMFPGRLDLEIEGVMEPATEVGGDLFDAFFVDDHKLFFCVGDVSGHGIPAALFMARTIGLLRILAMASGDPAAVLARANEQLSAGNDALIFVTLFCGFLDVSSGHLIYSNGGHCPPLLATADGVRRLPIPKGSLIGAFEGLRYLSMETTLTAGESLLCYTDGVTEAPLPDGTEYSEARLIALLKEIHTLPISAILEEIRGDVSAATSHRPLADDCTMLIIRRPATSS